MTDRHYPPVLLDVSGVAHLISYSRRQTQRLLARPDAPQPVPGTGHPRWRYEEIVTWAQLGWLDDDVGDAP